MYGRSHIALQECFVQFAINLAKIHLALSNSSNISKTAIAVIVFKGKIN